MILHDIYPDETDCKYNAHIKSRALAGCYEDEMAIQVLAIHAKEQKQEFKKCLW